MAEHLFVQVGNDSDDVTVVALNEQGHLLSGPDKLPLDSVAARVGSMQVTVLLPGTDVVSCLAEVPSVSSGRVRQMLPFVLEDEFASDVEELHFAAGERNAAGALRVSAIERARLQSRIERLNAAGITPKRICPETDGVPDTPGTVTLFIDGGRVLGRRADGAAFCFDELSLSELWALLAAESDDAGELGTVVLFIDSASHDVRAEEIDQWRQQLDNVNVRVLTEGCLPKLASALVFDPGANFLQGDFAPRSNLRALARPWKTAAAFALAFLLISVIGKGAELIKLGRDESRLTAEATSICARDYGSENLQRCLLEMGRRLASAGQSAASGQTGFLSLLSAVAGTIDPAMTIRNLSYRDQSLTLELNTPNASYLEAFDQRLSERGPIAVAPQNTTNESDGSLTVRLRISEANL